MILNVIATVALTAPLACADTFRSDVHPVRAKRQLYIQNRQSDRQQFLGNPRGWVSKNQADDNLRRRGTLVENIDFLAFITYFGIGSSPAQLMRAYIDFSWSDLFVPAINCSSCHGTLRYDHTKSSTFERNGTEITVMRGNELYAEGEIAIDTVSLGENVKIPQQPFVEARKSISGFWDTDNVESVLGLSLAKPFVNSTDMRHLLPGILENLAEKKVLDENIFSLLLPHGDSGPGDIMFGGYDRDLYEGEMSAHPLHPQNTTDWTIEATSASIKFLNGSSAGNQSLEGYIADLVPEYPFIAMPPIIGSALINATDADCSDSCFGCEVPCGRVGDLPEWTINLGGHNLTLGGWNYTVRTKFTLPFCPMREYCTLLIDSTEHLREPWHSRMMLGSGFLKNFYTVYDWEKRAVHFARAKHRL